MVSFNIVSILLTVVFFTPLAAGAIKRPSKEKMLSYMGSLLDNIELLAGVLLSIYITKKIFFENSRGLSWQIYKWIPNKLKDLLYGRDIFTYLVAVPIILLFIILILRIFSTPFYRRVVEPISEVIYKETCKMGKFRKGLTGALWQLPKALLSVLLCSLVLNFSSYFLYIPQAARWMNESNLYQVIYRNALYPVLNSSIAKQVPVIVNDSFRNLVESPEKNSSLVGEIGKRLIGNAAVIEYFNGVTLDEAIKSTPEIDNMAKSIVGDETDSAKKAHLIYKWISKNIKYDYEKSENIISDTQKYNSGSIEAFNTKKGICFDYSSLYVSMSRAVGLKVRMITGLGYSGLSWGDHAWNQVWSEEDERWIDVDTTFGSSGKNYFDRQDFFADHRDAEVQGEW